PTRPAPRAPPRRTNRGNERFACCLPLTFEPVDGIEPSTYGLRNRCSTTELHRRVIRGSECMPRRQGPRQGPRRARPAGAIRGPLGGESRPTVSILPDEQNGDGNGPALPTRRKPSYPISARLRGYLATHRRELSLPVSYARLESFRETIPLADAE